MTTGTIGSLFGAAQTDGTLSAAAASVININDLGATIQAGLGVAVDDVLSSDVTAIAGLIDDSGSIRGIKNGAQLIRDGHNLILDALNDSKASDGIIVAAHFLCTKTPLYPYRALKRASQMDSKSYNPNGGWTPLYDRALDVLATSALKTQEFLNGGVPCRTVTWIVTDGADTGSRASAADVATIIRDMLSKEIHIIAAVGIEDGITDYREVFREMCIQDDWILTPKNTASEIRRAFGRISRSAVRASQAGGASFSKVAVGGFAT